MSRSRSSQKTCWSVMANFFSNLTPSKLLVGYLYVSSYVLGNVAKAQSTETGTYYLGGNRHSTEPSTVCKNATPGCVLSVRGLFSNKSLQGFDVQQQCDDPQYHGRGSVATQIRTGLFHGNKLCDAKLTNTVADSKLDTSFRHNTDYTVGFVADDSVELTYSNLLSNPNRPSP